MKNPCGYLSFALLFFLISCKTEQEKSEQLARLNCAACHLFPDPKLLDKNGWKNDVLPEMKFRMGLDVSGLSRIPSYDVLTVAKILPHRMVSEEDWARIEGYYIKNAPDSLERIPNQKTEVLEQFIPEKIRVRIQGGPFVTLIEFDSVNKKLFIGNVRSTLYKVSNTFVVEDSFQLPGPASAMIFPSRSAALLTTMGIMDPNDQRKGKVLEMTAGDLPFQMILDSLRRPVHTAIVDCNNDGALDLVVSEFGNFLGSLSVFQRETEGGYKRHNIIDAPGCRKVEIRDFNADGLPDILALFTQGDERLMLFINEGDFRFSGRTLLRFPPIYGSSHFELADMDRDGHIDIIYSNGDNADYSMKLKPYHGVRIFINDGKDNFNQSWFYPMYGAFQVIAYDFDQDGDMDMSAISYFPDYSSKPIRNFLYFENIGNEFKVQATEMSSGNRWIVMKVVDIDEDDDADVVLGALNFPIQATEQCHYSLENEPVLLLLRNAKNSPE